MGHLLTVGTPFSTKHWLRGEIVEASLGEVVRVPWGGMAQRNDFADRYIRTLQRNTSEAESIDKSDRLRSELLKAAEGLGRIPPDPPPPLTSTRLLRQERR